MGSAETLGVSAESLLRFDRQGETSEQLPPWYGVMLRLEDRKKTGNMYKSCKVSFPLR